MNKAPDKLIGEVIAGSDFAVGNDVVFIPDFRLTFNELFQKKVYTIEEINYCRQFDDPVLRFASTWAAKEAVYKAVKQIKEMKLPFSKIRISRSRPAGKPQAEIPGDLNISLSISHDGDYVWAVALVRQEEI